LQYYGNGTDERYLIKSLHYNNTFGVLLMSTLGKNIKQLRQEKGISQDKLSKFADISLNTVVKLELDLSPNPILETLQKIAKALDTTIDNIVRGNENVR
jgi:transcriptional regulator with XRE-family HTH domain